MDTAAALADEKRVELIAQRTTELLRKLDALEWHIECLEALILSITDCANPLPI